MLARSHFLDRKGLELQRRSNRIHWRPTDALNFARPHVDRKFVSCENQADTARKFQFSVTYCQASKALNAVLLSHPFVPATADQQLNL
ncbi:MULTISPECIES: hypothetical protein [unclassified Mesorhizobium]|uniref:hypothetical protein n=1 Tax=unclassified Mesorhizobium TaxID=325217 RepID=UPI001CCBC1AE|nr:MULTISPECIES: hypothetical protein [unclassified Mesorhizobium]MBZ9683883.1 hypothetical protein [Mesorhizobium sp. CO1-1-2]MBZ9725390.1 hypothetical protein [Mesorhizobium sp. CO1-1-11]MBZ9923675.1 hypothetical protein [Mesorhizobium sp. BR1-1-4]